MREDFVKGQKVVRWLDILMLLAAAPHGMRAGELAVRTGVSRRTLERDMLEIERLRQLKVVKDGTRWSLMEGATLRPVAFEAAEATELLMALRLAVRHADHNKRALGMALAKVNAVMPPGAELVRRFVKETADELAHKPSPAHADDHLNQLIRAWIDGRKCEIRYTDAGGRTTTRVIHPYALEPAPGAGRGTYLVAMDEKSREVRSFKVERVEAVVMLAATYRLPASFRMADLLADSWGIWNNQSPQTVVLRFTPEAGRKVAESTWHPSQKIRSLPDGNIQFRVTVRGTVEITPWILGWGSAVEVISPPTLRQTVADAAQRMARQYSSNLISK